MASEIGVDDANHHDSMSSSTGATHTTYSSTTWDGSHDESNAENVLDDQKLERSIERTSSVQLKKDGKGHYRVVAVNGSEDKRGEDDSNAMSAADFEDNDFDALVGEFFWYLREKENGTSAPLPQRRDGIVALEQSTPRGGDSGSNGRVLTPRNSEKCNHDTLDGRKRRKGSCPAFWFDGDESDLPTSYETKDDDPRNDDADSDSEDKMRAAETSTVTEKCDDHMSNGTTFFSETSLVPETQSHAEHGAEDVGTDAVINVNSLKIRESISSQSALGTTLDETAITGSPRLTSHNESSVSFLLVSERQTRFENEAEDIGANAIINVNSSDTNESIANVITAESSRAVASNESFARNDSIVSYKPTFQGSLPDIVDETVSPPARSSSKSLDHDHQDATNKVVSPSGDPIVHDDDPYSKFYAVWTRKGLMKRRPTPLKKMSSKIDGGTVDKNCSDSSTHASFSERDDRTDSLQPRRVLQWPPMKHAEDSSPPRNSEQNIVVGRDHGNESSLNALLKGSDEREKRERPDGFLNGKMAPSLIPNKTVETEKVQTEAQRISSRDQDLHADEHTPTLANDTSSRIEDGIDDEPTGDLRDPDTQANERTPTLIKAKFGNLTDQYTSASERTPTRIESTSSRIEDGTHDESSGDHNSCSSGKKDSGRESRGRKEIQQSPPIAYEADSYMSRCSTPRSSNMDSSEFDADLELSRILDDDDSVLEAPDRDDVSGATSETSDDPNNVKELIRRARRLLAKQQQLLEIDVGNSVPKTEFSCSLLSTREPDSSATLASSDSVVAETASVILDSCSTRSKDGRQDPHRGTIICERSSSSNRRSDPDGYLVDVKSRCPTPTSQAPTPSNQFFKPLFFNMEEASNESQLLSLDGDSRPTEHDTDRLDMKEVHRSFSSDSISSKESNGKIDSPSSAMMDAASQGTHLGINLRHHSSGSDASVASPSLGGSEYKSNGAQSPLQSSLAIDTSPKHRIEVVTEPITDISSTFPKANPSPRSACSSNRSSFSILMATLKKDVAELTSIPSTVQCSRDDNADELSDDPSRPESPMEEMSSVADVAKSMEGPSPGPKENIEALIPAGSHQSYFDETSKNLAEQYDDETSRAPPVALNYQNGEASVTLDGLAAAAEQYDEETSRAPSVALNSQNGETSVTLDGLAAAEPLESPKPVIALSSDSCERPTEMTFDDPSEQEPLTELSKPSTAHSYDSCSDGEEDKENEQKSTQSHGTIYQQMKSANVDDVAAEDQDSMSTTTSNLRAVEADITFDCPLGHEASRHEKSSSGIPSLGYSSSGSLKDPSSSEMTFLPPWCQVSSQESVPQQDISSKHPSLLERQSAKAPLVGKNSDESSGATSIASSPPKPGTMRTPNKKFANILSQWEEKISHGSAERTSSSGGYGHFLSPPKHDTPPYHDTKAPLLRGPRENNRRKSTGGHVASKVVVKDASSNPSCTPTPTQRQSIEISSITIPNSKSTRLSSEERSIRASSLSKTTTVSRPKAASSSADYWDGMIQKKDEPNPRTWIERFDGRHESFETCTLMKAVPIGDIASVATPCEDIDDDDTRNDDDNDEPCTCMETAFSGDDHVKEFFLPQVGISHHCGKKRRNPTILIDSDPIALRHILRPWQVDFLQSVDIVRGDQLVRACQDKAGTLAGAMRTWRSERNMSCPKTMSCVMALHIWSRTCKYYVRTIRQQLADGMVEVELPTLSDVMMMTTTTSSSSTCTTDTDDERDEQVAAGLSFVLSSSTGEGEEGRRGSMLGDDFE